MKAPNLSEAMKSYRAAYVALHSEVSVFSIAIGMPVSAERFEYLYQTGNMFLQMIKDSQLINDILCRLLVSESELESIFIENPHENDGSFNWDFSYPKFDEPHYILCRFERLFDWGPKDSFYSFDFSEIVAIEGVLTGKRIIARFEQLQFNSNR